MTGSPKFSCNPSSPATLRDFLEAGEHTYTVSALSEFVKYAGQTSARWEKADRGSHDADEELTLNVARIVGQIWFRGQPDSKLSLKPGLYRLETIKALIKNEIKDGNEDKLFDELIELEHELRIDFISFAHLLNIGQTKTQLDWYFLMQHHGIPTRLLDWTTNALAGLFFALESYKSKDHSDDSKSEVGDKKDCVAVWMIDAYWLAKRLSDEWNSPLLPWSDDAAQYLPALEQMLDKNAASKRLIPEDAMPIEPPAMHPRVAAQEGRFIIFGKKTELLDHTIQLERNPNGELEELRIKKIQFAVSDIEALFEELAQIGVSRRTLFPDLDGLARFLRWKHFHKVGDSNFRQT